MTQRIGVKAAATVVAGALLLAGCSTAEPTEVSEEGQSLTVLTDDTVRMQPVVDAFVAANPGVDVQLESGGNSYIEFLRTRLAAGNAADVFRTFPGAGNPAAVLTLQEAGSLADLSDQPWVSQLNEGQRALFGNDEGVFSVPIGALALGPVWSDLTLDELGASVPETYSELLELCDTAKAAGKVAFALFQKGGGSVPTYAMVAPLVYGPEPDFTERQLAGDVSFADSGWVQAFEIQQEMNERGCFQEGPNGTDYNAAASLVANGEAVGLFAFSDTTALEDISPEGATYSLAPFPVDEDPDNRYLAVADSNGFAVNSAAENPELAMKFLEFLGTPEAQNLFGNASKGAPSLPNDVFEPNDPKQGLVAEYVASGRVATWPDQQWPGPEVIQTLDLVVQSLFTEGGDTPQTGAEKLDEAWAKIAPQ